MSSKVKYFVFVAVMAVMALPAMAQTATPEPTTAAISLAIDVNPLFDSIETYIPMFFAIFAIPGGIAIAIVLVRFIINTVKGAFEGKSL